VQAGDVHGHPLQQKSRPLPNVFIPADGELIEKVLMTVDWPRRPGRLELVFEESRLSQTFDYNAAIRAAVSAKNHRCASSHYPPDGVQVTRSILVVLAVLLRRLPGT